ncbi:MAG: PAS domain S-box protein [Candidatus Omnitrophica bacterium]|nr:PAS domain S-box protein [Candidatus Omnitrophota bacterium]
MIALSDINLNLEKTPLMKGHINLSARGINILCVILCLVILTVDVLTPVGVGTPLLYLIVVFLSLASEKTVSTIFFATIVSFLTTIGFFIPFPKELMMEGIINYILVLCAIWTTVFVGIKFKSVQEKVWILAAMVESAEDSVVGKDPHGMVIYWNKGAEKLYGYTSEEMVGQSIYKVFPDEWVKSGVEENLLNKLKKGETVKNYESLRKKKDGTKINVSLSLSPIMSFDGRFIGASAISRDITEQKKREAEKEKDLEDFQKGIEELFKQRSRLEMDILEKKNELKEKEEKLYAMIDECALMGEKLGNVRKELGNLAGKIVVKDQQIDSRTKQLESEIAERKKTEEDLRESKNRLKKLAAYMTTVREEERSTIAREIHDELGQLLTAIKMDLSWLEENAFKGQTEKFTERMAETNHLIDMTITSVQEIVVQLRPSILDNLGIIEAIKWQAKEFEKRTNVKCSVNINANGIKINNDTSTALFRIFQESLTNIMRHAQATQVEVFVDNDAEKFFMEISDNGRGMPKEKLFDAKSFGLMGMRERVEMFSGNIDFEGEAGKGTTVKVFIPLDKTKVMPND